MTYDKVFPAYAHAPIPARSLPAPIRDTETFLEECVATWIAARLREDRRRGARRALEQLEIHGQATSRLDLSGGALLTVTLAGVHGVGPTPRAALRDWLDRWQTKTGIHITGTKG